MIARHTVVSTLCVALFIRSLPGVAQPPSAPPSGVLLTGHDLALIGAATAVSAAMIAIYVRVAQAISDSASQVRHGGFKVAAKRASIVTETVLMVAGGTVYGIARLGHDHGTADVALHTTEAIASTAMVIQVIRGVLGRGRPFVVDSGAVRNSDPHEFQFLRGFTNYNYRSYPSMHAMASFAAASALAQEMRQHDTPHRSVIAPVLYAAATGPALARMYLDEHWASDIAMGIFLGVFAGQKAVMYSHDHPDNRVDNYFLRPSVRATVTYDARGFSLSVIPF